MTVDEGIALARGRLIALTDALLDAMAEDWDQRLRGCDAHADDFIAVAATLFVLRGEVLLMIDRRLAEAAQRAQVH